MIVVKPCKKGDSVYYNKGPKAFQRLVNEIVKTLNYNRRGEE